MMTSDEGTSHGRPPAAGAEPGASGWTFLTNHAHVLLAIAADPEVRMRDVATAVGVTERAVQMIVSDLETGGYLARARVGRRNRYTINDAGRFRHPAESDHRIGELLALFAPCRAATPGGGRDGAAAPEGTRSPP